MRLLTTILAIATLLLAGRAQAGEGEGKPEKAKAPTLAIKDIDVSLEKVEKVKRRLQGSRIVRDNVVIGWKWEVVVALERTPEAESGEWLLTGPRFERLKKASSKVRGWEWGKKTKKRVRVVTRGYLPAGGDSIIALVAMKAARELKKDLRIGPPKKPEPKAEPEPKREPEQRPRPPIVEPEPEPRREPPPSSQNPRLSRQESITLVKVWEEERETLGERIVQYRTIIKGAEGHEESVAEATKLLDKAGASLKASEPLYLACLALVDAGERVLLSLRLKVNTHHFNAQRALHSVERLLLPFTGPRSSNVPDTPGDK